MEEIKLEEQVDTTEIKFTQELNTEDLIEYNCHLVEQKAKFSLLVPIVGLFVLVMGIIDLFAENPNYVSSILYIFVGLFLMFGFKFVTVYLQKKAVRKHIMQNVNKVIMNVTVFDEGIRFEIPDEQKEEVVEEPVELSDEELRELDRHPEEEVVVEEIKEEVEEPVEEKQPEPNAITIPWGGIVKLENTEKYLFVNMVGYQALFIKKESCNNIEEVIEYAKDKLRDGKRFVEKQ